MRLIDADALCRVLNDHWLATSPSDRDTAEVAAERAAMCRGLDDAMRIAGQMPIVGGWVSVKDRLPDKNEEVIIYYEWAGRFSGNKYREVGFGTIADLGQEYFVIAWMPLPEPPEEVTGDE